MNFRNALTALMLLSGITAQAWAADFSYNYLELKGDYSGTKNISEGATEDADGNSFAFTSSHEISDSWYVRGGYSKEDKSFGNNVAGTQISLATEQIFFELGLGHRLSLNEQTDLYAEVLALDTEVQHDIPVVTEGERGPPQVAKELRILDGRGYGASLGTRRWLGERFDLEANIRGVHIVNETEVTLACSGRVHAGQNVALGILVSHGWSTDDNFNNILKAAVSLRFLF